MSGCTLKKYHTQASHDNATNFRRRMKERTRAAAQAGRPTVVLPTVVVDEVIAKPPIPIWRKQA